MRRVPWRWVALAAIAAGLVAHSLVYDFVCDDAYISFVYARNFAERWELVFNPGERVEGYTNFLWTLLLGLLMKARVPPEISSRLLGAAFAIGTLILTVRLTKRVRGEESPWDLLPAALLAASSGFACWTSGGLETQMFTFFCILGIVWYLEDRFPESGLAFAGAALTRPEGALVFALTGFHYLVRLAAERRLPRRRELTWPLAFLALFLPYFLWRWNYYGWPLPNTFYVKAAGRPPPKLQGQLHAFGYAYVWAWATQSKALFALPLALAAFWKRWQVATLVFVVTWGFLAYVVTVGGDFMGLGRFVMPLYVLVAVAAALGLADGAALLPSRSRLLAPALVLAAFGVTQVRLTRWAQTAKADQGIDRPGYLRVYAHDRGLIGKALAPHVRDTDFAIVGGAGVQPYYARLKGYDVFGLVSEKIAHEVPAANARPGHSKWGPASMLIAYQPTFVFSCYALTAQPDPARPPWRCPDAGFWLARGYQPVTLFVPGLEESGEYYTFLRRKDRAWP